MKIGEAAAAVGLRLFVGGSKDCGATIGRSPEVPPRRLAVST